MNNNRWVNSILLILFAILCSGFFSGQDDIYFKITKNMDLLSKVYKEVSFNYVDEIDPEEFMKAGIQGMLNSLDPYTNFMDENKKDEIDLLTNGKYGGVGISIGIRNDNVTVVEVLDGYSAQRQGIRIGDVILKVNGQAVQKEEMEEISSLVKGEPGTAVELMVIRNGRKDTLTFNLIREEVIVKSVTYYGFYPEESGNAYVKLSSFSRSAADELKKALKDLKDKREIKTLVLDLRGNPGGLLDVAVDICDKFLSKDLLIVSTKGRDSTSVKKYYSHQEPMLAETKLAVLVNEGSASASEIVAGAIQDHDRGLIVGGRTFGKGLVQTITPLSYNSSLKITTAKYYTPSGRCIQKIDYSSKNKVFTVDFNEKSKSYLTDHNRVVYSSGGIVPDSLIKDDIDGGITRELLAKGWFFKFADHFYYTNPNAELSSIENEKLFSTFSEYLKNQNFHYESEAEKQIEKVLRNLKSKKMKSGIVNNFDEIILQFEKLSSSELEIYKDEIIREIRAELNSRYLGLEGRIAETLKYDKQFEAAYKLVSDVKHYNKILNRN